MSSEPGTVTVENMGLGGVTVQLSGVSSASAVTDDNGQYAFTGLRMGNYSVEISGFDNDEIGFSATSSAVAVGTGESKIVSFDGTYLRTAGIQGQVSVEGVGLAGVNVSLAGGPDGEDMSTTTDAAGLYTFAKLRAGDYAVGISGFNTDDYEFAVTSHNVTIALGQTANVPFDGILRRTSGVAGRVSVNGMGIADVTVTVSADGMDDATAMTDASGQYAVSALAAGDYTVTISGYDAVEYTFEDSRPVTLLMDATMIVNFEGTALRTASIAVSVTADDEGVAGAAVTLTQITGATSGTVLGTQATDADGGATFGPLLAGNYRVDIAVDSDEIDFADGTSWTGPVATAEMATATFAGTINRTASIGGMVTVDGEGMAGVMVTLSGGADDSMETGDDGSYEFDELRKGAYTVSITNPDEARYEFPSTSESVDLAVGQEQSANFAGSMTRSSSISGTVTVDGTGVEGVMVTLSGDADDEATTDAGGLYTFTGLGAGDYTVSITLSDDQEAAYNFAEGETSKDQPLGDDDQQTVNFTGSHDTSASVSGMLFVDEATKNDMHDEGEHPFPAPGVPVVLVGPGVDQRTPTATDETGAFTFPGLRAGNYQLLVPITPTVAMALGDYAYGGPATGYEIELGVGGTHMQGIPFDITHTTVHFSVSLKSGEDPGDALPGATVNLYADAAGETMAGTGTTELNDDGDAVASIRVARAGTTGNTVHAAVSSVDYSVSEGMQAVMWDPKYTMTMASNEADIVNLNVDATISGATVDRGDYGGGDPLAGWDISVMMPGEGDEMVDVEGDDVPTMLGDDGTVPFKTTVESVPMTFTIAVAEDQDDEMDGGESYEADPVEYRHDGLQLAANVDADPLEVTYTTQTLKVYVHHELDQVPGYTGNILDGDKRDDGKIDLSVRHIDDAGRSRSFTTAEWDEDGNTSFNASDGATTYSGLPADKRIIVQASVATDDNGDDYRIMLLDPDELATYTALGENGVMGGAFGEMGGFSHTVSLCPLQAIDPTAQDHDDCSSFAYVDTWTVGGLVWKNEVLRSDDDANDDAFLMGPKDDGGPTFVPGIDVSLDPVAGKNIAGDQESFTTLAADVRNNQHPDDTHHFEFPDIAAGVYTLSASPGWRTRMGTALTGPEIKGSETMLGNALNPLSDDLGIDVTPATTTVYGYVRDSDDFPVDGVTVTVNNATAISDIHGRYIALGVDDSGDCEVDDTDYDICVTTAHEGSGATEDGRDFAANSRIRQDVMLSGSGTTIDISGTVTYADGGGPIAGAEIMVDDAVPNNATGTPKKLVTNADGEYTANIDAKTFGESATVSVHMEDVNFVPPQQSVPAHATAVNPSVNFVGFKHAMITGRVRGTDGNALSEVKITATKLPRVEGADVDDDATSTSNSRGTFVLSVPWGTYEIAASLENHTFAAPIADVWTISVLPGTTHDFGTIQAMSPGASNISATRARTADNDPADGVDMTERYDGNITVTFDAANMDVPDGYNVATYQVRHNGTADGMFTGDGGTVSAATTTDATPVEIPGKWTSSFSSPADTAFQVHVVATATHPTASGTENLPITITSAAVMVDAVDPMATIVAATRGVRDPDNTAVDTLGVTWSAVTNTNSDFRIVIQVAVEATGATLWLVPANGDNDDFDSNARSWTANIEATQDWVIVGTTNTVTVSADDLNKAIMVRVESRQGADGEWVESTPESVDAKPE